MQPPLKLPPKTKHQVAKFNRELQSDPALLARCRGAALVHYSPPCQKLSSANCVTRRSISVEFT
jgi:hypothetical protein